MALEVIQEMPKVQKMFPVTNSVFSKMDFDFRYLTNINMDNLFYLKYSQRFTTPLVNSFLDEDESSLSSESLQQIADLTLGFYRQKWEKLRDLYEVEYDPIHNFSDDYTSSETDTETRNMIDTTQGQGTTSDTGFQTSTRTDNLTQQDSTSGNTSNTRNDTLDRSELRTPNLSSQRTDNLLRTTDTQKGNTVTRTPTLTELETRNLADGNTRNVANSIYGFNSSTSGGSDDSAITDSGTNTGTIRRETTGGESVATSYSGNPDTVKDTGTQTTLSTGTEQIEASHLNIISDLGTYSETSTQTNAGTQTNRREDNLTSSSQNQSSLTRTGTDVHEKYKSYTRIGNIGNLTTQQMLREEIELWQWNFINSVMEDVRDLLTLAIY